METGESKLEKIVNGINNSDLFLSGRIKRMAYIPFAIIYGGVLRQDYQRKFAEKINWKEKNLTISNAIFLGLGKSFLYYLIGKEAYSFGNSEYIQNLNNAVVLGTASLIGITSKTLLHTHAYLDTLQSLFRIGYSCLTEKAIASFSLSGAACNTIHASVSFASKKINRRDLDAKKGEACGGI